MKLLLVGLMLLQAAGVLSIPQGYEYGPPTDSYLTPNPPKPRKPLDLMPYDFTWGVEDGDSGNTFTHVENSDGETMQGEYRVLLPDGRTQVVSFHDFGGGFEAQVTYEK
ncbi:pro-resilin-like [Penaeus chinensis]|uniref:pro-resilin-like n=1 Tax=Penaeus chinensis TaxID=139456 RepID=UPI001FB6BD59|nr:pro-resilin-like [Penaeus chinensis]